MGLFDSFEYDAGSVVVSINGKKFPAKAVEMIEDVPAFAVGDGATTIEFSLEIPEASFINAFGTPVHNPKTERDLEGKWLW